MRYQSSRNVLSFLGRLLRRVLAWRRPALVPVPVRRDRRGLTIVEMLVTLAITLIMMGAVVNLFANIGQSVNDSRAAIEMSSMLRSARQLLQQDLAGATCPTLPWTRVDAGMGYLEIIEGPATDRRASVLTDGNVGNQELEAGTTKVPSNTSLVPRAAVASDAETATDYQLLDHDYTNTPVEILLTGFGDYDDILALTVQSNGAPFVGRFGGGTIESNLAEVIWFAVENPTDGSRGEPGMRTVYRRVLLIAPSLGKIAGPNLPSWFFRQNDVSAHFDNDTGQWVANSLADLTKRENRFAHVLLNANVLFDPANPNAEPPHGFPFAIDISKLRLSLGNALEVGNTTPLHPFGYPFEGFVDFSGDTDPKPLAGNMADREGEDVVLTDVLAFDIRVFDPAADILMDPTVPGNVALSPGDPAWDPETQVIVGQGAYVDAGYRRENLSDQWNSAIWAPTSTFSTSMHPRSQLRHGPYLAAVCDMWSFHYEVDGINQDRTGNPNVIVALQDDFIDEGTDGIDNPPQQFGVDDITERETSPPYPVPLRSVEVRLRTYERDSRQVREVSVHQSFVPQ